MEQRMQDSRCPLKNFERVVKSEGHVNLSLSLRSTVTAYRNGGTSAIIVRASKLQTLLAPVQCHPRPGSSDDHDRCTALRY